MRVRPEMLLTAAALVTGLAGCNEASLDRMTSGIYSLHISATSDTCEPARATGSFQSGITVEEEQVRLFIPQGTRIPSFVPVHVGPNLEFNSTQRLAECDSGQRRRRLILQSTESEQILATLTTHFTALSGCPEGSFAVPELDCYSSRTLRLRRRTPCPTDDGCRVVKGEAFNEFFCMCE